MRHGAGNKLRVQSTREFPIIVVLCCAGHFQWGVLRGDWFTDCSVGGQDRKRPLRNGLQTELSQKSCTSRDLGPTADPEADIKSTEEPSKRMLPHKAITPVRGVSPKIKLSRQHFENEREVSLLALSLNSNVSSTLPPQTTSLATPSFLWQPQSPSALS